MIFSFELQKMNILHINWSLKYGGIETMLVNIANSQAKQGETVSIVIINNYIESALLQRIDKNIDIYQIGRVLGSHSPTFYFRLNTIINTIGPDVIHIHDSRIYCLLHGKKNRDKTVLTLHALPYGTIKPSNPLLRFFPLLSLSIPGNVAFIDRIRKIASISKSVRKELLEQYNVNSHVIENGILVSKFREKQDNGIVSKPLKVIQVGRLDHIIKGQDLLIEAASSLRELIDVTIVGDGPSMPLLMDLIKEKACEGNVHLVGSWEQESICNNLCNYDLFVMASRKEGFGLTVAEAMVAGLPVLVSSGQGPEEVICGEKYGWVFNNGDSSDLAKKICFIIESYQLVLEKARSAKKYAREMYDVSNTAKQYIEYYKES